MDHNLRRKTAQWKDKIARLASSPAGCSRSSHCSRQPPQPQPMPFAICQAGRGRNRQSTTAGWVRNKPPKRHQRSRLEPRYSGRRNGPPPLRSLRDSGAVWPGSSLLTRDFRIWLFALARE
ncbi:hypothetical protein SORBI_3004G087900 [Sorghum bicolor]|uniref:Uncharacterized protein n=1 Tax=Sorghum bicolor TaxID=4558 RepID=A0A194YNJ1_SORBI|nr:hypothetical protein SORBI_3004G087900 [Sorghum bicolor]